MNVTRSPGRSQISIRERGFLADTNYFSALGVSSVAGRTIVDADDRVSAEPVAVISYAYWQRRFGLDPAVIGKTVRLNDVNMSVIGVTPEGFSGTSGFGSSPDYSIPISMERNALMGSFSLLDAPWNWWTVIMGRMKPGIAAAQVQAELERILQASALDTYAQFVELNSNDGGTGEPRDVPSLRVLPGARGMTNNVEDSSLLFFILISVFALLWLLGCLNVANLLMARYASQRREIDTRLVLGASRLRIVRHFLTESMLLALLAGVIGLFFAYWGKNSLTAVLPQDRFVVTDLAMNYRVLAFTIAVCVLTGIVFGLAPAFHATRHSIRFNVRDAGRTLLHGPSRFAKSLIVVQSSLLLVLLLGASLLVGTLRNLQNVDVGFELVHLLSFEIRHSELKYDNTRAQRLYDELLERRAIVKCCGSVISVEHDQAAFSSSRSG